MESRWIFARHVVVNSRWNCCTQCCKCRCRGVLPYFCIYAQQFQCFRRVWYSTKCSTLFSVLCAFTVCTMESVNHSTGVFSQHRHLSWMMNHEKTFANYNLSVLFFPSYPQAIVSGINLFECKVNCMIKARYNSIHHFSGSMTIFISACVGSLQNFPYIQRSRLNKAHAWTCVDARVHVLPQFDDRSIDRRKSGLRVVILVWILHWCGNWLSYIAEIRLFFYFPFGGRFSVIHILHRSAFWRRIILLQVHAFGCVVLVAKLAKETFLGGILTDESHWLKSLITNIFNHGQFRFCGRS